ncbi:hypothetical protein [Rhizobium laguerreae]|uniref:hypothetical protein n=1 Tax=Rhizobium laguerreae TaxID=1076926 RepID=UPI001C8FC2F8|nr:hypothetical protein [Rhizobium laguerreae]MBY3407331.1 hypothetical protein [Rhizobium laguerreae]
MVIILAAAVNPIDNILIDISRRIQVPKTKHVKAADHFLGLRAHLDRKVVRLNEVSRTIPSGSFSICNTMSKWISLGTNPIG